ncbi:hypothetical protein ACHAPU_002259 [Fusarium lateritium]
MEPPSNLVAGLESLFLKYVAPIQDQLAQSRHEISELGRVVTELQQQDHDILRKQDECGSRVDKALRENREPAQGESVVVALLGEIMCRLQQLEDKGLNFNNDDDALLRALPDDPVDILKEIREMRDYLHSRFVDFELRLPPKLETEVEPEKFFIKYLIEDPVDTLALMSNCGILEAIKASGEGLEDAKSATFVNKGLPVAPGSTRRLKCHLLIEFNDYESEMRARTNGSAGRIREKFALTQASCMLPQVFELEVMDYYQKGVIKRPTNESEEMDLLIQGSFPRLTGTLTARVSYNRLLLSTHDRKVALNLDLTKVTINNKPYEVFKKHPAWSPYCRWESVVTQRALSTQHARLRPTWAMVNGTVTTNASPAQLQAVTTPDSSSAVPSSSQDLPKPKVATKTKRSRGRPRKVEDLVYPTPQPIRNTSVERPTTNKNANQTNIATFFQPRSSNSATGPSPAAADSTPESADNPSESDVEMGETTDMFEDPSSSQQSTDSGSSENSTTTNSNLSSDDAVSGPDIKGKGVVRTQGAGKSPGKGRRSRNKKRSRKSKGNDGDSGESGSPQVLEPGPETPHSAESRSKRQRFHSPEASGSGKLLFPDASSNVTSAGAAAKI